MTPELDALYADQRRTAETQVRDALPKRLRASGPTAFGDLWPKILCACHLTYAELKALVWDMRVEGTVVVEGLKPRERSIKDEHVLSVP